MFLQTGPPPRVPEGARLQAAGVRHRYEVRQAAQREGAQDRRTCAPTDAGRAQVHVDNRLLQGC